MQRVHTLGLGITQTADDRNTAVLVIFHRFQLWVFVREGQGIDRIAQTKYRSLDSPFSRFGIDILMFPCTIMV